MTIREHSIILPARLIPGLLAGTITQLRLPVKAPRVRGRLLDHPLPDFVRVIPASDGYMLYDLSRAWKDSPWPDHHEEYLHVPFAHPGDGWAKEPKDDMITRLMAPWSVGERLVAKETWSQGKPYGFGGETYCIAYKADGWCGAVGGDGAGGWMRRQHGWLIGIADKTLEGTWFDRRDYGYRWRSSTQMPRWAARLTPTIASIGAQRLGDATEADALAEGICRVGTSELLGVPLYADSPAADPAQHYTSDGKTYDTWCAVFVATWEKTYGKKYPSAGSPWCWLLGIKHG